MKSLHSVIKLLSNGNATNATKSNATKLKSAICKNGSILRFAVWWHFVP